MAPAVLLPLIIVAMTSAADIKVLEELEVPLAVNLLAVAVGGLSGTLRAGDEENIDVVGMFALALCFGFGGGIVRDVLLGYLPPAAFRNPAYIGTVLGATLVGSIFLVYLDQLERPMWFFDSLTTGLFAAVGANAALITGLAFLPVVFVGTLASVGGSLIADALQARPSALLYQGPPAALAGMAGAVTYVALWDVFDTLSVTLLAVAASFGVRIAGALWNLRAPVPLRHALGLRTRLRELWGKAGARPRRHTEGT